MTKIYRDWAVGRVNSALVTTSCILSLVGTLLIIVTYFLWKDIRTTSRRILVFISIADYFVALGNLLGLWYANQNTNDDTNCVTQSFVTSTATIMSSMWSVCLAIYLYILLVKMRKSIAEKLMPLFHILSWLTGIVINIAALQSQALGDTVDALTGGWCWIKYKEDPNDRSMEIVWMLIDGQLWLLSACVISFCLYAAIKIKMRKELQKQKTNSDHPLKFNVMKAAEAADRKLIFIPFLFVLVRIWGTIRFVLFLLCLLPDQKENGDKELNTLHKILLTLQGVGDSAQGFVNCILFCFMTPKVLNHLKHVALDIVNCCSCKKYGSRASSFSNEEDKIDYHADESCTTDARISEQE